MTARRTSCHTERDAHESADQMGQARLITSSSVVTGLVVRAAGVVPVRLDLTNIGTAEQIPELVRLGRTLHAWRVELCAHFDHPDVSNGPTENPNLKIKNTKGAARGYRNFDHYRLRLLLNHGRIHEDHSPTRIRTRSRFAA
jgi:hypothetical protein